jgi:hypothetical protein
MDALHMLYEDGIQTLGRYAHWVQRVVHGVAIAQNAGGLYCARNIVPECISGRCVCVCVCGPLWDDLPGEVRAA